VGKAGLTLSIDRLLSKDIRKAPKGDQDQDGEHGDQQTTSVFDEEETKKDIKQLCDAVNVLQVL
jgi:hypothetical protein